MATLNELKKRLRSIKTTGQLAGAMKTVSTAKYSKLCSVLEQYRPYAREDVAAFCDAAPRRCCGSARGGGR